MLGTWRWNVGFGLFGVALIVIFSLGRNPIAVVLLRTVYAFIAFFALAYMARLLLAIILKPPAIIGAQNGQSQPAEQQKSDEGIGEQLNLTTPESNDDLNDLIKSQLQGSGLPASGQQEAKQAAAFKPLNPPQLVSSNHKQPEELAKAVRHLTGE